MSHSYFLSETIMSSELWVLHVPGTCQYSVLIQGIWINLKFSEKPFWVIAVDHAMLSLWSSWIWSNFLPATGIDYRRGKIWFVLSDIIFLGSKVPSTKVGFQGLIALMNTVALPTLGPRSYFMICPATSRRTNDQFDHWLVLRYCVLKVLLDNVGNGQADNWSHFCTHL